MKSSSLQSVTVAIAILGLTSATAFAQGTGSAKGGARKLMELNGTAIVTANSGSAMAAASPERYAVPTGSAKGGAIKLFNPLGVSAKTNGGEANHAVAAGSFKSGRTAKGGASKLVELSRGSKNPNFQIAPIK